MVCGGSGRAPSARRVGTARGVHAQIVAVLAHACPSSKAHCWPGIAETRPRRGLALSPGLGAASPALAGNPCWAQRHLPARCMARVPAHLWGHPQRQLVQAAAVRFAAAQRVGLPRRAQENRRDQLRSTPVALVYLEGWRRGHLRSPPRADPRVLAASTHLHR